MKYPEHNGRTDGADPWSIRQTGVYQSFDTAKKTSIWILLNPRENTVAENRIKGLLNTQDGFSDPQGQPPLLGLIVLSMYLNNWRTYMAYYEKEELRMVSSITRFPSRKS